MDIALLGIALKQLAGNVGAIRITCTQRDGFVVELFDDSDIASSVGVGADGRFSIAYQKAKNKLMGTAETAVSNGD